MRRHGRRIARKNRIRRTTTSTIRGVPRRGDDRVDAGERSSPRRPLRKNWANWREDQTAATPRTRFPRKRSPGAEDPRTRTDPPHGPSKTRAEPVDKVQRPGREIPDRALRKRANTDVASRARLPGFSPPRGPENAQRRGSANGRSREARAHLCDVKARRRSRGYSRVVTRASRSRKTGALPSTACVEAPL